MIVPKLKTVNEIYGHMNIHNTCHCTVRKKIYSGKNLWCPFAFECFSPFLSTISTATHSSNINLVRYNLIVLQHCNVCNLLTYKKIVLTEFVGMFMIYVHTKFCVPSSKGSFCTESKMYISCTHHVLVLHCKKKKNYITKISYFSKIYQYIKFQDSVW